MCVCGVVLVTGVCLREVCVCVCCSGDGGLVFVEEGVCVCVFW